MGQVQSDEYHCEDETTEDVTDSELNSQTREESSRKYGTTGSGCFKQISKCSTTTTPVIVSKMSRQKQHQHQQQQQQHQHVRKLSNVSNRNIQLLSMKPRSEKDAYADNLRSRRRSSLINLILGAPSSGPGFSDDLCSLSSHISECNFGIEFFPDVCPTGNNNTATNTSISSFRLESSTEDIERGDGLKVGQLTNQKRRRSSLGSIEALGAASTAATTVSAAGGLGVTASKIAEAGARVTKNLQGFNGNENPTKRKVVEEGRKMFMAPSAISHQQGRMQQFRKPSLTSTLASIDLTSSFEQHDKSGGAFYRPPLYNTKQQTIYESNQQFVGGGPPDLKTRLSKGRVNQGGRVLRRSGSELSLYSTISAGSGKSSCAGGNNNNKRSSSSHEMEVKDLRRETKLIIILQVCLPFILAGFGNMAAGLVLNRIAQWRAFQKVPIFFVLLPPFIGLKGNIEMTLASRLSTLSNLNLLDTGYQRRRAYESNLILILSQAIGLSVFAAFVSILCEFLMGALTVNSGSEALELFETAVLVVLASALVTSVILVFASSIIVSLAIGLANLIQVNPDNLSTLIAALYGDVSCVLVYGLVANWMFSLKEQNILIWPIVIVSCALVSLPILLYLAYKFKETQSIAISSIPPMLASIMVSIGSGAVLSLVIGKFKLIALYQPVVNGFGANLIAVQASRVSTWLWCSALRTASNTVESANNLPATKTLGSLASFTAVPELPIDEEFSTGNENKAKWCRNPLEVCVKIIKTLLWSFCNPSPNSVAARLLLIMLIPAHTIYFSVIWLLAPANHVTLTWQFYFAYLTLCVIQVFILLTICEPLMTLLMRRNLDPDIFGISLLMALADLIGTLCLTGAFFFLAALKDPNAL